MTREAKVVEVNRQEQMGGFHGQSDSNQIPRAVANRPEAGGKGVLGKLFPALMTRVMRVLWLTGAGLVILGLAGNGARKLPTALEQAAPEALLDGRFRWVASEPLLDPADADGDHYYSVKDPSVVYYQDRWHVFYTIRGKKRSHQTGYVAFKEWSEANRAPRHTLRLTDGYFCAPQVFYFRPQRRWYLVYQVIDQARKPALQPAYSTAEVLGDPGAWTPPKLLFAKEQKGVEMWIDFWVVCDEKKAHVFWTDLKGKMFRAETSLADFPNGWGSAAVALEGDIYEASHIYRLKGMKKYLTMVEARAPDERRYYKAYLADRLDGAWKPLAATPDQPFASVANVTFNGARWTDSISHGELIRDGYDETLTIDPAQLRFLFQGVLDQDRAGKVYGEIPWRLGLLSMAR